jgi:squalene synthase HpnC
LGATREAHFLSFLRVLRALRGEPCCFADHSGSRPIRVVTQAESRPIDPPAQAETSEARPVDHRIKSWYDDGAPRASSKRPATDAADNVETWSGKDRGDENFPVGSLLISRALRPHVHAFYTFARNADDIADSAALPADEKIARLDTMEAVLLGQRDSGSPSALRLRASLAATGVTARHATDLLVAFRRDATQQRTASWDELYDYCRYSAMPVGRHVLDLHNEDRATHAPSDALCTALQVLNHLQDCANDLAMLDRSYLPLDLLTRHGATIDDVRRPRQTGGLRAVFDALLDRVDALNIQAADLPRRTHSRRLRLETAVIAGLALRLTGRLRHGDPLATRVRLTKGDAVASALASLRHLP